jgi:hypothetical protein
MLLSGWASVLDDVARFVTEVSAVPSNMAVRLTP